MKFFCESCQRYVMVRPYAKVECDRCAGVALMFVPVAESLAEALQAPLGVCSECEPKGLSGNECFERHFGERPGERSS